MTREEIERAAHDAKPVSATALGYSISAGLGDKRNIVCQCFVAEDEDDLVVNARIDRVMRVIDRQQAVYDLEAEMEGFQKRGETLQLNIAGLPIAAHNLKKEIAIMAVKLQELETTVEAEKQAGYNEWTARGAKGEYKPKGFRLNKINACTAEIERIKAAIEAKPKDENQHRDEVMKTISVLQEDLKKRRAKINKALALLGQEPNLEYLKEEAFVPEA